MVVVVLFCHYCLIVTVVSVCQYVYVLGHY